MTFDPGTLCINGHASSVEGTKDAIIRLQWRRIKKEDGK